MNAVYEFYRQYPTGEGILSSEISLHILVLNAVAWLV